jgi:hypothetical protein
MLNQVQHDDGALGWQGAFGSSPEPMVSVI